jgi:uncharacterized membrane protein YeaQ/YmgE (transglycosylase-associated protein family)
VDAKFKQVQEELNILVKWSCKRSRPFASHQLVKPYGKERKIRMGVVSWIVVGLIAGWLAGMVMKGGGFGLIGDIIVGVVGGLLGGWIATSFLHMGGMTGINLGSILIAFAGAVVLLLVLRLVRGGRR